MANIQKKNRRDLSEIFGYAASDLSKAARTLWEIGACPFTNSHCIKHNHDKSITYGTCSVHTSGEDIIICPNRLYADNYDAIKKVAADAFGSKTLFYRYGEYVKNRTGIKRCVVALGQNSGKEVKAGQSLSMDWILAEIDNGKLSKYIGIEVQSIDITGNYRDAWHGYKNYPNNLSTNVPASAHGLNWANVHKRLIPQLIRKSLMYSKSAYVEKGMYFIVPEIVYKKFEALLGELPVCEIAAHDTITVHTYSIGPEVSSGQQRPLEIVRKLRFPLEEMSMRFITGPNLPPGQVLDDAVKHALGVK